MQKPFQILLVLMLFIVGMSACSPVSTMETETASAPPPTETQLTTATETPALSPTKTIAPTEVLTPTPDTTTTIVFTGVIVPARCVQAGVDAAGSADYIYDEVREILSGADLTVGVYNAAMSDQVEMIGCQSSWELVGTPNNADALQAAGFDVMSVATNHIMDCGRTSCGYTSFFDTLDHLNRVGIQTVGAGEDLAAAMQPVIVESNGTTFGFISLGEVNERVFADWETPGIAVLTHFNLMQAIQELRDQVDVLIVMPHTGPEDYPEVTPQQNYWARNAAAAGADLVVENHAHIVQGYEWIDDVPVFYSLGNFVFDQIWARDHQQGVMLEVVFDGAEIVDFTFYPTIVDQDGTVHLARGDERQEIIDRIEYLHLELVEE